MRDPSSKWHLPRDRYSSTSFPPYAEGPLYVVSQVRENGGVGTVRPRFLSLLVGVAPPAFICLLY